MDVEGEPSRVQVELTKLKARECGYDEIVVLERVARELRAMDEQPERFEGAGRLSVT